MRAILALTVCRLHVMVLATRLQTMVSSAMMLQLKVCRTVTTSGMGKDAGNLNLHGCNVERGSGAWFGKMQLVSGFLLEVSPWCRDYTVWTRWQSSMPPPVLLKMASSGTNPQLLPCLFIVYTRAKAKQSKILLELMFDICYIELPIVHSNF